jgi:hypothetical protein
MIDLEGDLLNDLAVPVHFDDPSIAAFGTIVRPSASRWKAWISMRP